MRDIRFLLKTHYTSSRALVIGIDRYERVSPLSYAVSDATAIRDILVSDFGFPPENITFLTDAEATGANIRKAHHRFAGADVDLDDRIVVFFAGHGETRTGNRGEIGFLVPFDADLDDLSTLVRWDELTKSSEMIRAKHVLYIMDACYGGLALNRSVRPGSVRFLKDMLLRYSRQVLTAGKADEVVADAGGPLPNHSVFTGHLIEGLRGQAATEDGIITASGLMAYVYGKVANDPNSDQTPHYGYFDGDGDFVLLAPSLTELEEPTDRDVDQLIAIPFPDYAPERESTASKTQRVKQLLSADSATIELHDFLVNEARRFLSLTSEDHFDVSTEHSTDEFLARVARYEVASADLAMSLACVAHWGKPEHRAIMQKVLARCTDRLESQGGLVIWLALRWYPIWLQLYSAGLAAVDAQKFESLTVMFYARVPTPDRRSREGVLAEAASDAILELTRYDAFRQLPGHEQHQVPLSEYLFKILQPKLDDIIFLGKSYERAFDTFEVLLSLAVADLRRQRDESVWGPVGRFGWKHRTYAGSPLTALIAEARAAREAWAPLQAGLFGGSFERFDATATEYVQGFRM